MYIDDLTIAEIHDVNTAQIHVATEKEKKTLHARHCESTFNIITTNADTIGMKINESKTQLTSFVLFFLLLLFTGHIKSIFIRLGGSHFIVNLFCIDC